MEQYKLYYKNIIQPLNNKYTYIDKKLINLKWYEVQKRVKYLKLKNRYKKIIDRQFSIYVDKFLIEIVNKPLTEDEKRHIKKIVNKALEKIFNEENKKRLVIY